MCCSTRTSTRSIVARDPAGYPQPQEPPQQPPPPPPTRTTASTRRRAPRTPTAAQHLRRSAVRAGDDLVVATDELLEVRLALHARVLVDRHRLSVMLGQMQTWQPATLTGELVRLEPLSAAHADGLWDASRDASTWRWLPIPQPQTREELDALARRGARGGSSRRRAPLRDASHEERSHGRLDALSGAATRARGGRDRLDLAPSLCVGHGRQRGGEAADADPRLRDRGAVGGSS